MLFFIPAAKDENQKQAVYQAIKKSVTSFAPGIISARKIFSLSYMHDGTKYHVEVGKPAKPNGELVLAILYDETRDLYHVCTPHQSIMCGANDVLSVLDFDS